MRLKSYILTICILLIAVSSIFGQVDRKHAKFMDTCAISVISSEIIAKSFPTDSTNQFYITCNCSLPGYKLLIFNRWGKVVLSSFDIRDELNFSTFKEGVYVWVVEAKYPNGKEDNKKGAIKIE